MKQHRISSRLSVLVAGIFFIAGCATGGDEVQPGATLDDEAIVDEATDAAASETETAAETSPGSSGGTARIPDDFWPGTPVPDYELLDVVQEGERDYALYMRGTDIEADAHALEALLLNEGFHRLAWGITEENGATGVFLTEDSRVTFNIQDHDGEIEIVYLAGPYEFAE